MKNDSGPPSTALRLAARVAVGVAPIGLQVALLFFGLAVVRWIQATDAPSPFFYLLALIPPFAELWFSYAFEIRERGVRIPVVVGAAVRVLFAAFVGFLFVVVPLRLKGTWDNWFVQDLAQSPRFLQLVWGYSPLAAVALGAMCAWAYLRWTVRRRQARLTTTVLLPGVATFLLFLLLYHFPHLSLRGPRGVRPDFVTQVWTPAHADHRIPREVVVSPDERFAVATFGSTFPMDASDPPANELRLNPVRCDPPMRMECRRNLALIDLESGTTRTWSMPMTRRFFSEDPQRTFVLPYRISELLDLRIDGTIRKHPLPALVDGQPFDEVNFVYYAADLGRVYLANGNNPVVLVWDARAERVEKALQLAGWNRLALGDVLLSIARSRSRGRLYVSAKADHPQIVEIDEAGLQPLRSFTPAGYDVQVSPDEKSIFSASFLTGEIWRFDSESLRLEATLPAPVQSRRISFSPDGTQLFAASYLTGELVVYDTRTNRKVRSFYVAPRLEGMSVAGGGLYLLSAEGLFRVPLAVLKEP
jgi:DNA-binding beta-propeller fold protein YncE